MHVDAAFVRLFLEALLTSWVVSQREQYGVEWCRQNFMGPWRRAAGTAFPPNTMGITAEVEAHGCAANVLRDLCMTCGGCELGREPEPM